MTDLEYLENCPECGEPLESIGVVQQAVFRYRRDRGPLYQFESVEGRSSVFCAKCKKTIKDVKLSWSTWSPGEEDRWVLIRENLGLSLIP